MEPGNLQRLCGTPGARSGQAPPQSKDSCLSYDDFRPVRGCETREGVGWGEVAQVRHDACRWSLLLGKDKKDTSVSPYMHGRLRQNLATWQRTTQDSFVLSVIDSGYKIDWNNLGPPPPKYSNNSPNCANHLEFINSSIAEAQAMGVICETSREKCLRSIYASTSFIFTHRLHAR